MKNLLFTSFLFLSFQVHAQQAKQNVNTDQFETDKFGYVLNCGGQLVSSTRYFLLKRGIVLPENMGSVAAVAEWMQKSVEKNKPLVEAKDAAGKVWILNAAVINRMIEASIDKMSNQDNYQWSENQIDRQALGLPEKIDECDVEPVWEAQSSNIYTGKGNWDLLMSLKPIDQVFVALPMYLRKVDTTRLEFARALKLDAKMTRQAWIQALAGGQAVHLPGPITAKDCVVLEANKQGAFKCRSIQLEMYDNRFAFISEKNILEERRYDRELITSIQLNPGSADEIVFSANGRLLYITAGALIHSQGKTFDWLNKQVEVAIKEPFYDDVPRKRDYYRERETLLPTLSPRNRKIFFDEYSESSLEHNDQFDRVDERYDQIRRKIIDSRYGR